MEYSKENIKSQKMSLTATAIGSLPHTNADDALELIFSTFKTCPLWPQLSHVSKLEDMTTQYLEGFPGVVFDRNKNKFYFDTESENYFDELESFFLDYDSIVNEKDYSNLDKYKISNKYSSAINKFYDLVADKKPEFAKGHIIGPLTLGLSLTDQDGKNVFYDDVLKDVIIKGLTLKAIWQIEQIKLASPNTTPIIFLDEPAMSQYGTSALITIEKNDITGAIQEISTAIQDIGGLSGVHCCGKTDWAIITDSNINILNFDAFFFAKSLTLYSKSIEKFLKKGNYIAWGITPTLDEKALEEATTDSICKVFADAVDGLCQKGLDKNLILEHSLITPSCGAGGLNMILAEKAMKITAEVAIKLNKQLTTGVLK